MKKLLAILFVLTSLTVYPANVTVPIRDITSGPVARRTVIVTLVEPTGMAVAGPWLIAGDTKAQLTDTNGVTTFTNMLTIGKYRLDVAGSSRSWPFSLSAVTTNGTYNIVNLLGTNAAVPVFYDAAQVDALIGAVSTNGGGAVTASLVSTNDSRVVRLTNTASLYAGKLTNGINLGNAFSSPGTGISSESFGSAATASGEASTVLGNSAMGSATRAIAIGYEATAASPYATAIGANTTAIGTNSTAIGASSVVLSDYGTVIGPNGSVEGMWSVAVGGATVTHSNSIVFGLSSSTADNQILFGTTNHTVLFPGDVTIEGTLNADEITANVFSGLGSGLTNVDAVSLAGMTPNALNTTNATLNVLTNETTKEYYIAAFGKALGLPSPDKVCLPVNITSNSTTLTAASGSFSADDVGKRIVIAGGGLTNHTSRAHFGFTTTIVGFTNSSTVGLNAAPSNTVSSAVAVFDTDYRLALQLALNTLATNNFSSELVIPEPGIVVGPGLSDPGMSTNHHNAAVFLPPVHHFGYPTITIRGTSKPSGNYDGHGALGSVITWCLTRSPGPYPTNTARFFDMNDLTAVQGASLASPKRYSGAQHCRIVIKDLTLEMPFDNDAIGWDLYSAFQATRENLMICALGHGSSTAPVYARGTNGIGVILPFEASYNEHGASGCSYYNLYCGASLGAFKEVDATFYVCTKGFTAFNSPKPCVLDNLMFMECSNAFYIPANASAFVKIGYAGQINSGAVAEWAGTNFFVVSEDGGFVGTIDTFGYYTPTLQTNGPALRNGVGGVLNKRIKWRVMGGDGADVDGGTRIFADDVVFRSLIYGDRATVPLTIWRFENAGAYAPSWGGGPPTAALLPTTAWSRVHYNFIPFNGDVWTNKSFQKITLRFAWTNAGVACIQAGYFHFTSATALAIKTYNRFITNAVAGNNITTEVINDTAIFSTGQAGVQPYVTSAGNLGANGLFSGSHSNTNAIWLLDAIFEATELNGGPY